MGVKTSLAGITLTGGDITQAEGTAPIADLNGLMQVAQQTCVELIAKLTIIHTIMTNAGDSSNASTVNTQITNLS